MVKTPISCTHSPLPLSYKYFYKIASFRLIHLYYPLHFNALIVWYYGNYDEICRECV